MARYIDADKLCKALKNMASTQYPDKQNTILGIVSSIENFTTADVVPKSEVERLTINMNAYGLTAKRLKEDVDRLQEINNNQVENIRLAKQEVARGIFEEIETLLVLNSLQGDVFTGKYFGADLENDIADLKKKYTEVAE